MTILLERIVRVLHTNSFGFDAVGVLEMNT